MGMELGKIGEQAASLWSRLSLPRRAAIVLGGLAVLGLAVFFAARAPAEAYGALYSGLSPEDAGQVLELLRAQNVPFRIAANGTAIEVPEERVHELRISLASSGIPRGGGAGFELFDKQTFGTTTFVEQMNYQRALSGELARTIGSIDAVERARVHLAIKERSLFKKDDDPPSASVVVKLRRGRQLLPQQVKGVVHLVSSSVEGLIPDRVTLLDDSGAVLWPGDEEASSDMQRELERTLKRRIYEITDSAVGRGHSVVAVTAELDTARSERTEELYDKDRTALRSESVIEDRAAEGGAHNAGGLAGARGNLPGASAGAASSVEIITTTGAQDPGVNRTHLSSTRNFEVNRVVNRVTGPKARVARLHVAILIDAGPAATSSSTRAFGRDRLASPEGSALPSRDLLYGPRPGDLERIGALAREAAGLDLARGDRLEVHSIPFALEPKEEPAPAAAPGAFHELVTQQPAMAAGVAAAALLLIFGTGGTIAVVRRRRKKRAVEAIVEMPALPRTAGELATVIDGGDGDAMEPEAMPLLTPRDRAIAAVRADTARAARILSAWLAEAADQADASRSGGRT